MSEFVMVKRELLQNCANYMEGSASGMVQFWHDELSAVLAQEAGHVEEPLGMVELVAWRRREGICGCKRFMTDRQYKASSPRMQKFYEPFSCANYHSRPAPASLGHTCGIAPNAECDACLDKVKELNQ